ncbi:NAD-dependent succinate-semialdehyde dehydrogenase [Nocardioides sp. LS1]|uniref:NAD-dependent succinate-semialdehyde dehydrogenase n=1 Tax=Nocardioides sp. LS1 TaxID=1027620 RepID=UPI000F626ACE|nr:NAD-dependent succinate-semialdehyde dehydrogenase [Nocardioides sp. LS1]GCD90012.1 NAD-dependent succinate-semialdehyde dehydrogenase [Nocardioides sp. LS1]
MDFPTQLFLNGEWKDASNGATFDVVDPATGEVIAQVADATADDVRAMVEAAVAAQDEWAATPAVERAAIMHRAVRIFEDRIEELARLLSREQGKPLAQAVGEMQYGVGFIDWFAEEARRIHGSTIPATTRAKRIITIRQPLGVTACITPWNFPSLQILRKLGAALAAGCTMIVKPAELTPLSALEIARVFDDAGLPPGVLQVATSNDAPTVSAVFMADARVRGISFTGSTEVGKILMRGAADTMKRVSLELGGHAPFIVFADADMDLVVREAMAVKLRNMGQTCVSANRFFVHEDVAEEFGDRLATEFRKLIVGNPLDDGVDVGPLVEEAALVKVEAHVADALEHGARVVLGGSRVDTGADSRLFFEPTVILDADDSMLLAREETFGPVAPIFTFRDEDEVVRRANASDYGLAGYFFTRDLNRAIRVAERLEYGTVGLNDAQISAVQAPFGGVKQSGIGREGGPLGVDEYLDTKYLSVGGL